MRKVVVHEKTRVLDDFFKVDAATVSFERFDGVMSAPLRRLSLERGDSVAALLHDCQRERLILVNQFKYPTYVRGSGWITELVAGMVDAGESYERAIRREVLEETGYEMVSLQPVSTFYLSPGGSSERVALFYGEVSEASRTGPGGGREAEHEDIELIELEPEQAMARCARGEIVDAKTLIALLWFDRVRRRDEHAHEREGKQDDE